MIGPFGLRASTAPNMFRHVWGLLLRIGNFPSYKASDSDYWISAPPRCSGVALASCRR